MAVDLSGINPVKNLNLGSIGTALLVFAVAVVIMILVGGLIFLWFKKRQLKHSIPLFRKVGNRVIKIATFRAKDFKIGRAGDKLWYVPKVKKYIIPATLQTAPNEYTHFEREDGEWINIEMPDIDAKMKSFGVKYIHQDMRSNRIAIADILDARFKDKQSWWEKYGHLITHLIFYLIVGIMMVVIFYQWSGIVEDTKMILDQIVNMQKSTGNQGIIPAIMLLGGFKKW